MDLVVELAGPLAGRAVVDGSSGRGLRRADLDADDPRFAECFGDDFREHVIAAFPFAASLCRDHFPRMGLSPELDVDRQAFAVVFAEDWPGVPRAAPAEEGRNHVCVYVGRPPDGELHLYGNVDITGMSVDGR